jgi:CRISPR system Cascade subunit CasA
MNLIEDKWIPARRRSGKIEMIAPWEITDAFDRDPFTQIAAPRPDFNGALIQFLIGLLQTCFAPQNSQEWRQELRLPPPPGDLRIAFLTVTPSFNLDGEGPRFMQDLTLSEEVAGLEAKAQEDRVKPIADILIDIPTGKTLRDNTDFFVKRGYIEALCPACAGTALFTMQTNAPSGGQGHRTGIRGGGPLTTLVLADSLWGTCWLSVLERSEFLRGTGNPAKNTPADQFPWLAPTRTSEEGRGTTPEDAHPTQIFWAMPRRIRLLFSNATGVCDLCGKKDCAVVLKYLTKNLGTSYTGPWKHSLSPYFIAQDGVPSPFHPRLGGIGYRHWLGLVQSSDDGRSRREPAAVVARYLRLGGEDVRLWAFGYDMDNMKARCWYDSCMPLTLCSPEIQENFAFHVSALIRAADIAAFETRGQVRKALFKQGSEVKGDFSFITSRFWQETEPGFFTALPHLRAMLQKDEDATPILESWHKLLVQAAEAIFNDLSQTGAFEAADPKRIALAWRGLRMGLYGKKLKQTLGLR